MDKEDVVHIYTMEYYSAIKKNKIGSFVDGSRVCHTKNIRKRKKNCILMHICGNEKNGTDEHIFRAGVETQCREWPCGHSREGVWDELKQQD